MFLCLIAGIVMQSPKLTPEAVAQSIKALARQYGIPCTDKVKARAKVSEELVRLNAASEETVKRACEILEIPGDKPLEEPFFDEVFLVQLWFLLRYYPGPSTATEEELYDKYHFAFVAPHEHGQPDRYDYPWNRDEGRWQLERFDYRIEGGYPGPTYFYKLFSKLPRRIR